MAHKNRYMNMYGSVICNNPKLGATQMSFNRQMVEQLRSRPCHILFSYKKEQSTDIHNDLD